MAHAYEEEVTNIEVPIVNMDGPPIPPEKILEFQSWITTGLRLALFLGMGTLAMALLSSTCSAACSGITVALESICARNRVREARQVQRRLHAG